MGQRAGILKIEQPCPSLPQPWQIPAPPNPEALSFCCSPLGSHGAMGAGWDAPPPLSLFAFPVLSTKPGTGEVINSSRASRMRMS